MKSCRSEVPVNKSSFAVKTLSCLPNFSITLAVILKTVHTSYTHVNTWNKMHNKQQNKHTQYDIMVTGSAVNFEETNFDSLIWPYLYTFSAEVPRPLFPGWRDVMAVCVLHAAAHRSSNFPKVMFFGSSWCPCRRRPDPSLSGSFETMVASWRGSFVRAWRQRQRPGLALLMWSAHAPESRPLVNPLRPVPAGGGVASLRGQCPWRRHLLISVVDVLRSSRLSSAGNVTTSADLLT